MSTQSKSNMKAPDGFTYVHWRDWDPKAFTLQMSFEKASEKRKPTNQSPMTYINIVWTKYRGYRLIIITPKMDLFGISRRKDQNNKELETDNWTLRWRLKSSLEQYIDEDQREFHQKCEEFDNEMQRQIDAMNEANGANAKTGRKQKERAYMGIIRAPESVTADYLYTSCQLMYNASKEMLKDFTLIRVTTTAEDWNTLDSKDLMEKYSLRPERYQFKYTPEEFLHLLQEELPDKNQLKDMIPPYSSGVQYMEVSSIGFNTMMITATPKIHRCLYFSEPRAMSMNMDLAGEDVSSDLAAKKRAATEANTASPYTNTNTVTADATAAAAAELNEANDKKVAVVEQPVTDSKKRSSTEAELEDTAPPAKEKATPAAVKIVSSISSGTKPASSTKPSSTGASSSSSSTSAKPSSSAAPATVKKVVSSSSSTKPTSLQGSLDKL